LSIFTTIFLVATIGLVTHMIINIVKISKGHDTSNRSLEQVRDLEARLESMERRLQNVETIATDKEYSLERKFEELVEK